MTYANPELGRSIGRSATSCQEIDYDIAIGEESKTVVKKYDVAHFLIPYSRQWHDPVVRFITLKKKWEEETTFLSSVTDICMHSAYQQIIGMGPIAIPLILSEMKIKPGHWFWALQAITGENPVSSSQRGRIKQMTESWIRWGKEQGY